MDGELTRLDPAHKTVMRIEIILTALPVLVGAIVLEILGIVPWRGVFVGPVVVIAVLLVGMVPLRRYLARGYDMASDRLRVVRGLLFRHDTVVPFGRVQHIDVEQGPLERMFDIARLILHTAGTHNSSVVLPGLKHADALAMREAIRARIKRDTM